MILHDQSVNIEEKINKLDHELAEMRLPNHCVHAGPIIRQEQDYLWMDVKQKQKILKKMMAFFRSADVSCKSVYIEKRQVSDPVAAKGQLAKEIGRFIKDNLEYFLSFDTIKDILR